MYFSTLMASTTIVLFWLSTLTSGCAIAQTGNGEQSLQYEITFRDFTVKHTWAEDVITDHSCEKKSMMAKVGWVFH
jgi:hypothetical protein